MMESRPDVTGETLAAAAASGAVSGGNGSNPQPALAKGGPKVGRNEPCWCGSGKKYKRCHGA